MKRSIAALALASLAAAPLAAGVAYAQDRAPEREQSAPVVTAVEFRGNVRTTEAALQQLIGTKAGQRLDRALLAADQNELLKTFLTVDVREQREPGGVRLVITVSEGVPATTVDVVGTDEVPADDVRRAVRETRPGRLPTENALATDAIAIQSLYRSKGFHFVQVVPRTETAEGGGSRVVFEVLEGPKVDVRSIEFTGNASFTKDKLLENVAMRETRLLGLIPGDYVADSVTQDLLAIRNTYRAEGWLDAEVGPAEVEFSADRSRADIRVPVREGERYTVGSVRIEGAESFPGGVDELSKLLAIASGDGKRDTLVRRSMESIERAYRDEGFYAVVVTPEEKLRPDAPVADLTFRVVESSKVRVRSVEILGNTVTQDKVIRREISVAPGDVLNQNGLDKSVRKLRGLGYFERVSARIEQPADGDDPNLRDVKIAVDDTAPTGSVRFGVGVSSDTGLSATLDLTKRNFDWKDLPNRFGDVFAGRAFTGAGQTFQLELSPGNDYSRYRIAFTEPWMFDKPISFGWDLFMTQFRRFEYDQDARGLDFFLGRRWTFDGRERDTVFGVQARTRIEAFDVDNLDERSSPTAFLAEGSNSLISEEFTFRLSRLDSDGSPTAGWYAQAGTEFGFAGDVRLWKNSVEAKRYWTLGRNDDERPHVLSLGARLSVAAPMGGTDEADASLFDEKYVPIYESYFAGGSTTVRGFAYGGAGPHGEGDPMLVRRAGESQSEYARRVARTAKSVLENDGDPLGGRVQFLTSAEYGFPVYADVLRGVLFADAGMVRHSFASTHGLEEDDVAYARGLLTGNGPAATSLRRSLAFDEGDGFFSDVRISVGFGLRIKVPALGPVPLALDIGIPLRKQDGDDTQVVSFSISRQF